MAIYHFTFKPIKRSAGRSATAAAAYRAALEITDERTGEIHNYGRRRGVADHAILAPRRAPEWAFEAPSLWNQVEQRENRKNSQLARENIVALPHELTLEQNRALLHGFVQEQYIRRGMAAQVDIHTANEQGDARNIHAHILLTLRGITRNGWKEKKARSWNEKSFLMESRQAWAEHMNRALEQAGVKERVTEKSFEDLGLDKVPTKHLGVAANGIERRGGKSIQGEKNRRAKEQNAKLQTLRNQEAILQDVVRKEAARLAKEKAEQLEKQRQVREKEERQKDIKEKSVLAAAYMAEMENRKDQQRRELLDRGAEFWNAVDRDYENEEVQIRAFYALDAQREDLQEAKAQLAMRDNAMGRFSGAYDEALEEVETMQRNLESAEKRQAEALDHLHGERDELNRQREERAEFLRDVHAAANQDREPEEPPPQEKRYATFAEWREADRAVHPEPDRDTEPPSPAPGQEHDAGADYDIDD